MWKNIVEREEHCDDTHFGLILAHSMGLGIALAIIYFLFFTITPFFPFLREDFSSYLFLAFVS